MTSDAIAKPKQSLPLPTSQRNHCTKPTQSGQATQTHASSLSLSLFICIGSASMRFFVESTSLLGGSIAVRAWSLLYKIPIKRYRSAKGSWDKAVGHGVGMPQHQHVDTGERIVWTNLMAMADLRHQAGMPGMTQTKLMSVFEMSSCCLQPSNLISPPPKPHTYTSRYGLTKAWRNANRLYRWYKHTRVWPSRKVQKNSLKHFRRSINTLPYYTHIHMYNYRYAAHS